MSRRVAIFLSAVIVSLIVGSSAYAALQPDPGGVSVKLPDIEFVVYQVQDPYHGVISQPAKLDPEKRYVGAEISIVNRSHFPVSVSLNNVRLRDADGQEYAAGGVLGEDIRLNGRTLAELDLARGWVWFALPLDAQIAQIVFIPSTLEMRIPAEQLPLEASPAASPAAQ